VPKDMKFHGLICAILLLPPLAGCSQVKEAMDKEKTVIPPTVIKVTVPTETVKPKLQEVVPADVSNGNSGAANKSAPKQGAPAVEENLLPQQLPAGSSSDTMPIPVPIAPKPKPLQPPPPSSHLGNTPLLASIQAPDRFYQGGVITEDTLWSGDILVEGALTVAPQATLTVSPGTVVRFRRALSANSSSPVLLIQGRLLVTGTPERKVRFTSDLSPFSAGEWQGILFLASEKKNQIEHCIVEGAECGLDAAFSTLVIKESLFQKSRMGFRFQDSLATLSGGGALDCEVGFTLVDSEIDIRDASFTGNRQGGVVARTSLYLTGSVFQNNGQGGLTAKDSRLKLTGNIFAENGHALALTGCEGSLTGARILRNSDVGLSLAGSRMRINGNEITGNLRAGIQTEDGKGIIWGNAIFENGQYNLYHSGADDVKAIGNWWGLGAAGIQVKPDDRQADSRRGRVLSSPVLKSRPDLPLLKGFAK